MWDGVLPRGEVNAVCELHTRESKTRGKDSDGVETWTALHLGLR